MERQLSIVDEKTDAMLSDERSLWAATQDDAVLYIYRRGDRERKGHCVVELMGKPSRART